MHCRFRMAGALALAAIATQLAAQQRALPPAVRQFVSIDVPVVALTHARLVDGTGTPAKVDQTIVIQGEKITAVGKTGSIAIPEGAQVIDLTGKTVIPGIIGLHDHMYYGGMRFMGVSYPRLFLSAGVTTIRTTGSVDAYQELNLKRLTDSLLLAGPSIVVTGPYLQGFGPGPGTMHPLSGPEDARRMVRYWADEGVTWFKAYTQVSRAELAAAIDEAHKDGVKVTAHLCSVGFREAVSMGIDQLEHGLLTNTEYYPGKRPDVCPAVGDSAIYGGLDIESPDVQLTIREMVAHHVALTSTLDVFELGSPSRVPVDQRVLDALYPDAAKQVAAYYASGKTANDSIHRVTFAKSMRFERAFVKAGGLLGAGSDPCCASSIAGYGDQRNYELLIEAGFPPEQAIQIMTSNGAKILGFDKWVGTVAAGMQADLVVIAGDPLRSPSDIRNVETVFRRGIGFDPVKLRESVKGLVGLR
ncbi:MAG: amidohydrolase family protein [Gemmatimonadota bacterium]|nr:amidohydrolase family protein [Gemmatimonadota bacterium]